MYVNMNNKENVVRCCRCGYVLHPKEEESIRCRSVLGVEWSCACCSYVNHHHSDHRFRLCYNRVCSSMVEEQAEMVVLLEVNEKMMYDEYMSQPSPFKGNGTDMTMREMMEESPLLKTYKGRCGAGLRRKHGGAFIWDHYIDNQPITHMQYGLWLADQIRRCCRVQILLWSQAGVTSDICSLDSTSMGILVHHQYEKLPNIPTICSQLKPLPKIFLIGQQYPKQLPSSIASQIWGYFYNHHLPDNLNLIKGTQWRDLIHKGNKMQIFFRTKDKWNCTVIKQPLFKSKKQQHQLDSEIKNSLIVLFQEGCENDSRTMQKLAHVLENYQWGLKVVMKIHINNQIHTHIYDNTDIIDEDSKPYMLFDHEEDHQERDNFIYNS